MGIGGLPGDDADREVWKRLYENSVTDRVALRHRAEAAEAELEGYRLALFAHHDIATLSDDAIDESIGGTCQICARATADLRRRIPTGDGSTQQVTQPDTVPAEPKKGRVI